MDHRFRKMLLILKKIRPIVLVPLYQSIIGIILTTFFPANYMTF